MKDAHHHVDMGKYESRDGDKTTGNYWVVLPDGRRQTVYYYVDGNSGFVAKVKYEGYAKPSSSYKKHSYKPHHY